MAEMRSDNMFFMENMREIQNNHFLTMENMHVRVLVFL